MLRSHFRFCKHAVALLVQLRLGLAARCGCGQVLEAEVADLRQERPKFLAKLGQPYPARQVLAGQKLRDGPGNISCDAGASLSGNKGGPWRLKVDLDVAKGPYKKEHRVVLEVPPGYPAELPAVRFSSKVTSSFLKAEEQGHSSVATQELMLAMRQERQKGGGTLTLRGILTLLHMMLTKPLDGHSSKNWEAQARAFTEETGVVRKYGKKRKHNDLFTIRGFPSKERPHPVVPRLREALGNISGLDRDAARALLISSGVVSEVIPGMVYSFEVFTDSFCQVLMEEIRNFYSTGLPARRPNSMNNYGIILNDIGLEPLMFALQDEVIQPLAAVLFPKEGSELESHHAFTIRYRGGEDTHLDVHTDDSDVTFNVNIFGDYEGCPLVFCGIVGAPDHRKFRTAYQHRLGHAVMHSGRHRHGAEDITEGERMNLVVWSYSYNFRQSAASRKKHKREIGPPDKRCVSYTHDRDYGRFKDYPPGKRDMFLGRGWCPQKGKEYKGFVPDAPESSAPKRHPRDDYDL
mmetsp:Transcript_111017/g.313063  ORF Transcript_111017/g.313063 Transcript_111017/m.313063 type:complete len:519 (-) Transcript_111017:60-1616(-)